MSSNADDLTTARDALSAHLARCAELLDAAGDDEQVLAVRDFLLDLQLESRALITLAEERLGAFSGDDDPRAIALRAEELIETTEGLQDAWESRVDLLLAAGFDSRQTPEFLAAALHDDEGLALLADLFTGLPSDMDQTVLLLDYAKRYLLALLDGPARA